MEGLSIAELHVRRHLFQLVPPAAQGGGHQGHPAVQGGARTLQVQGDLFHHPLKVSQDGEGLGHLGEIHLGTPHLERHVRREMAQPQPQGPPQRGAEERGLQSHDFEHGGGEVKTPRGPIHRHAGKLSPLQGGISRDPGVLPGAPALDRQGKPSPKGPLSLGPEGSHLRSFKALHGAPHPQLGEHVPLELDFALTHAEVQLRHGQGVPLEREQPLTRKGQGGLAGALPSSVELQGHRRFP
ncbi:MAG: hypothetical protein BWY88_01020 [Synergistetes bacterium ADurb.Bin520]|nr:MAG: hypothetical protein BWY88_01020 [Synergistetes bacterium ADurb.Bin520]